MSELAPRAHVVLLVGADGVVLMRDIDHGSVRYRAPGVILQSAETPGRAAGRAARERLGVEVEIGDLFYADTEHGVEHYFFLATPAATGGGLPPSLADPDLVVLRRTALLGYHVEPAQLARLLSLRGDAAVKER